MTQKAFFTNNDYFSWSFNPNDKGFNTINSKTFPAAFFPIIGVMAEDCNYRIQECYCHNNRLFFKCSYRNHYSELMLRYGNSELIVARIEFIHKRSGNMTKLFEVLKHIKRSYHLDKIVIESVQTDEMKNWCQKHKFTPCGDANDYSINWEWNGK